MPYLNSVHIMGHAGKDAEAKTFSGGGTVCSFSLATDDGYFNKDKEWQTKTNWHNIQYWGTDGDQVAAKIHKGDLVLVQGKVEYRSYEKDGETKYVTDIKAFSVKNCTKKEIPNKAPGSEPGFDTNDEIPF